MNTDLTVGKPWKVLLKYILPLFGSAVFQQLYTLADTIIAGRFAGQTALTAIGASNAIVNILMAVSLGANAGCAVLVSRYFGARQNGKTKNDHLHGAYFFCDTERFACDGGSCHLPPHPDRSENSAGSA